MNRSDTIMTIQELSEYLKISTSSLYKLAQQGRLPGQKIGKHWRFRKLTIDKWIDHASPNYKSRKTSNAK